MNTTKEKEDESQSTVDILRSTIEGFKDVLIFSIDKSYRYLAFNSAFKAATYHAYGTEVANGTSMLDSITSAEDRAKAKLNCDRAMQGEAHMTTEVYGDLQKLYFETKYCPIIDKSGYVTGVTVMSSNVTERKLAEEQLLKLNGELNSFSYTVSHDLRAPLRAINAHSRILLEDFPDNLNSEARSSLEAISRNSRKMGNLIDDLLTFSHLGRKEVTKSKINMDQLVKEVVKDIEAERNTKRTSLVIHKLPSAWGENALLAQVWHNLLSNAFKYSRHNAKPSVEVGASQTDTEVTYHVKDNGVGFDMKFYHKLFGVFQRLHTEREFEGTGVGLAIVERIVSKHGGRVWGEGKLNEGATFYFSLPRAK